MLQHLLSVDVDELLGYARQKRRADRADFRALVSRLQEFRQIIRKELHVPAGTVLQHERETPGSPTPGIAGGEKLKAVPDGNCLSSWFKRA